MVSFYPCTNHHGLETHYCRSVKLMSHTGISVILLSLWKPFSVDLPLDTVHRETFCSFDSPTRLYILGLLCLTTGSKAEAARDAEGLHSTGLQSNSRKLLINTV